MFQFRLERALAGSFVALNTPFNRDGKVDVPASRELLAVQESHGTVAVLIMGSTGEVSLLSPEEKKTVIVETARMKTGRMTRFYGCAGNNTDATIASVKFAADNGADGAILAAPADIRAPEDDIERYFLDIADATDLPLGICNNRPRVKSDPHWDHLLRLCKHPNYVVHKESTTRVGQVAQILAANPDVSVICRDSPNLGLVVPTMSLGGHGTANMTGNIAPAEMAALSRPWTGLGQRLGREADDFRKTDLGLRPLLRHTYSAINPVAVTSLMKALGMPSGNPRRPLTGLEGEALARGLGGVKELGPDAKYGWKLKPISAIAAESVEDGSGDQRPAALVTGGSRGMGRACAAALAAEGAEVFIMARTQTLDSRQTFVGQPTNVCLARQKCFARAVKRGRSTSRPPSVKA